jgi:hypothetical protein
MLSSPLAFVPPSGKCLLIARNIDVFQINPVNVSSSLLSLELEFALAVSNYWTIRSDSDTGGYNFLFIKNIFE